MEVGPQRKMMDSLWKIQIHSFNSCPFSWKRFSRNWTAQKCDRLGTYLCILVEVVWENLISAPPRLGKCFSPLRNPLDLSCNNKSIHHCSIYSCLWGGLKKDVKLKVGHKSQLYCPFHLITWHISGLFWSGFSFYIDSELCYFFAESMRLITWPNWTR